MNQEFKNMILEPFKYIESSKFFSKDYFCNFLNQINENADLLTNGYDYSYGASKMVIIPEDSDFVVKIPFRGQLLHDRRCYHNTDTFQSFVKRNQSILLLDDEQSDFLSNDDEYDEYDHFSILSPLSGAYDYVTETDYEYDYCGVEEQLYLKAEEAGLASLFAKTEYINTINGYEIYIQQKCDCDYRGSGRSYSEEDEKSTTVVQSLREDSYSSSFALCWLIDVYNTYGEEMLINLLEFEQEWLRDMHYGNYGYRNGKPIILDYSGFNG